MATYSITQESIRVMNRRVTKVTCFQSMGIVLIFVELSERMNKSKKLLKSFYWGAYATDDVTELHLIEIANYGAKYDKLPVMTVSHVQTWDFPALVDLSDCHKKAAL